MNQSKAKKIARIIAIVIVASMVITSVTALLAVNFTSHGAETDSEREAYLKTHLTSLKGFIDLVQDKYKDEIDYKLLIEGAYAGVIGVLNDPYSEYFFSNEAANDFVSYANSVYEGIGVSLEKTGNITRFIAVIPDSSADKAGIQAGDILLKVNNIATLDKSQQEIVSMIRGESGTSLNLLISRNDSEISYTLKREIIHTKTIDHRILEDGVGYIRIDSFGEDTANEFKSAREDLTKKGAKSLIIDVRDNPGGVMDAAINITEQLIGSGIITHISHKGVLMETIETEAKKIQNDSVVLLINEDSASAAEIMAAALQDNKSAILVGAPTYGKGVGQTMLSLDTNKTAKLSSFYFLRPNKESIDKVGVKPDFLVPMPSYAKSEFLLNEYESFAPMPEKVKPGAGEIGLNVFGAQQRLRMLGYNAGINGVMDEPTVTAISDFQKSAGLYPYGTLDYTTIDKLENACIELIKSTDFIEDPQLAKAISLIRDKKTAMSTGT